VGVRHLGVLAGRGLVPHRGIADPGNGQLAAEAGLVEGHRLGAVAVEQQEWCELHRLLRRV
jgi:hypothetical protein